MQLTLFSPAKVNLFLCVLGQRSDGYHELASLFHVVNYGDTLTVRLSEKDSWTASNPALPLDSDSLLGKTLALFREKSGWHHPVSCQIEKKIPMEAGLGGGSSNAATLLWALNELAETNYSPATLAEWGASLGADIPFFFSSGCAYCQGKGEIFHDIAPIPLEKLWLVKPPWGVSTAEAFALWKREGKPSSAGKGEELLELWQNGKVAFYNDLEPPLLLDQERMAAFRSRLLQEGFALTGMTGSGSTYLGIGEASKALLDDSELFCQEVSGIVRQPNMWYGQKLESRMERV